MLRRFQNFKLGSLDARRLNDMQDAIIELQRRVDATPRFEYAQYGMTLARIEDRVTLSNEQCPTPVYGLGTIKGAVYKMKEILLRADVAQGTEGSICLSGVHEPGMLSSYDSNQSGDRQLDPILVDTSAREYRFNVGDVVSCYRVRLDGVRFNIPMSEYRSVYVLVSGGGAGAGEMRIATLVERLGTGMYQAELNGETGVVELNNLYETQAYYGAGSVSTECATVTPGTLPIGAKVWASKVGGRGEMAGKWITMTPVPFSSVCTCGELGQPLQLQSEKRGREAVAVGIISRLMGIQ